MPHDSPPELVTLLGAPEGPARDQAWAEFVERHSRLLLHVARSYGGDHDAVMDRYTFILERLRSDDCRRLRTWASDRRSKLTTWLVIVAQRLSLDQNRQRYGRPHGKDEQATVSRATRRRLADLLVEQLDHAGKSPSANGSGNDPEAALRSAELSAALNRCVAELSSADQLLLTLKFRDGLSAAGIARGMHFPSEFHVYRQLDRLLRGLRQSLHRRGVENSLP